MKLFERTGRKGSYRNAPRKVENMKTLYAFLTALLTANLAEAKTYTLGSGKWTDANVWNNDYPGTTIKADDIVVIKGQVTMNTAIVVEGTLTVDKGAFMVGMKDLVISKSGKFNNNGNTVMKRILNEGTINNSLIMEAMNDVDNKGLIQNNNNMVAGNNFSNYGGNANGGAGGAYFVNNSVFTSPAAKFGKEVKVFYGNEIQNEENMVQSTSLFLNASFKGNNSGVVLNILNPEKLNIAFYKIEKSFDGANYTLLETVTNNSLTLSYTDNKVSSSLTYYRVKALNANGDEVVLPVATVKAPNSAGGYTDVN